MFKLWYQDERLWSFEERKPARYCHALYNYDEALNFFVADEYISEQEALFQNKLTRNQFLQLSVQQQQNLLLVSPIRVYRTYTDPDAPTSYCGDGEPCNRTIYEDKIQDLRVFFALPGTPLETAIQNNLLLFEEFLNLNKQEHYNLCYWAANRYLSKRIDISLRAVLKLSALQINNLCSLDNAEILAPYDIDQIAALSRGQLTFEYVANLNELQQIFINLFSAQQIIDLIDSNKYPTCLTDYQVKSVQAASMYIKDGYLSLSEALNLEKNHYENISGSDFKRLLSVWVAAPGTSPEQANSQNKFTFLQVISLKWWAPNYLLLHEAWLLEKRYLTPQEFINLTISEKELFFRNSSFHDNVQKVIAPALTSSEDALYQNKITFTQARALQGQALENFSSRYVVSLIAPSGITDDEDAIRMNKITITQALSLTHVQERLIWHIGGFIFSIKEVIESNLSALQLTYALNLITQHAIAFTEPGHKENQIRLDKLWHLSELQLIHFQNSFYKKSFDLNSVLVLEPTNDYPVDLSEVQRKCLLNPVIFELHSRGYLSIRDILVLTSRDSDRYNQNFNNIIHLISSPSDSEADALYQNKLTFAQASALESTVLENFMKYRGVMHLRAPTGVTDEQEALAMNKLTISKITNLTTLEFYVLNVAATSYPSLGGSLIPKFFTLQQAMQLSMQQKINIWAKHEFAMNSNKPTVQKSLREASWYLPNLEHLTVTQLFQQDRGPKSKLSL